jgi:hypothetical protein
MLYAISKFNVYVLCYVCVGGLVHWRQHLLYLPNTQTYENLHIAKLKQKSMKSKRVSYRANILFKFQLLIFKKMIYFSYYQKVSEYTRRPPQAHT